MHAKKELIAKLNGKQYDDLISLPYGRRKTLTLLISLTYDKKDVISWRAMEAIGLITGEIAKTAPDHVRNTAGRLLWMIRDESGGIGWSAPEILGEIVRNNPELCADIAPVIVSFHEEKMLNAGVLWAIGRIGKLNTEFTNYATSIAASYLKASEEILRGYAASACGILEAQESRGELEKLLDDNAFVPFYEDGELKEKRIRDIASEAINKLKSEVTV